MFLLCVRGRYGLLGPNGCGKSLFMHILGRRMMPIPDNVDTFHVVSEIEASDMTALEAVLAVDEVRTSLEAEADSLSKLMMECDVSDVSVVMECDVSLMCPL